MHVYERVTRQKPKSIECKLQKHFFVLATQQRFFRFSLKRMFAAKYIEKLTTILMK
jgi:hypothetical protein